MLSKEAVKAKKKYKRLGGLIAALVVEPWKPKMWKVKAQRFNFDYVVALNPKSKGHKKEKLCLLYTSPSPRDKRQSRMPSSA